MSNTHTIRKRIITGILLFSFIVVGFLDALTQGLKTYSSVMGLDINRVYFYTFFLLVIGCWLLYGKWFVGIGFLSLAAFNNYFIEYLFIHNYIASILIYIGILIDIITRRKFKWLIPLAIIGLIQGITFQTTFFSYYIVGLMEFTALCIGSIFVIKYIDMEKIYKEK
ncbi:MAG: hypothetical protein FWD47_08140 [Treponema sp.]|nr:hypothetical protein [Treponema sp.]